MFSFPIQRRILIEKTSFKELQQSIEQEFENCSIYCMTDYRDEYRDTYFFIKNNIVLLEAQILKPNQLDIGSVFFVNPCLISDFECITFPYVEIKKLIIKLLKLENKINVQDNFTIHIKEGSDIEYVLTCKMYKHCIEC